MRVGFIGLGSLGRAIAKRLMEEEAIALVAYLKWMSSIDTNGFPANFPEVKVQ